MIRRGEMEQKENVSILFRRKMSFPFLSSFSTPPHPQFSPKECSKTRKTKQQTKWHCIEFTAKCLSGPSCLTSMKLFSPRRLNTQEHGNESNIKYQWAFQSSFLFDCFIYERLLMIPSRGDHRARDPFRNTIWAQEGSQIFLPFMILISKRQMQATISLNREHQICLGSPR